MSQATSIDAVTAQTPSARIDAIRAHLNYHNLIPVVCEIVGKPCLALNHWQCEEVEGGRDGHQVFHIAGTATYAGIVMFWSFDLKVLRRDTAPLSLDADDWQRKALLAALPAGPQASTCYKIDPISPDEIWIWLEDVDASAAEGRRWETRTKIASPSPPRAVS